MEKITEWTREYEKGFPDPTKINFKMWRKYLDAIEERYRIGRKIPDGKVGIFVNKISRFGAVFNCGYVLFIEPEMSGAKRRGLVLLYPPFQSEHSEFVPYILDLDVFLKFYEQHEKIYNKIESSIIEITKEEGDNFTIDEVLYNISANELKLIREARISIKVISVCLANIQYEIRYNFVLYNVNKHLLNLVKDVFIKNNEDIKESISAPMRVLKKIDVRLYFKYLICGIKFIPLSNLESTSTSHLLTPWTEKLALLMTTEMVLNSQCWGFPLLITDFYLHKIDSHLFENQQIRRRYADSPRFEESLRIITTDIDIDDADAKKQYIKYAEAAYSLSSSVLLLLQEWCGYSIFQEENNIILEKYNEPVLIKFIFDIVFNLYALTTRQILHCDPHIGNITLQYICTVYEQAASISLYQIEDLKYYIPELIYHATLIDFSEALIFTDEDPHERFPFKQNLIEERNNRIFKILLIFAPELTRNLIPWDNLDLIFRALITYDLYLFCNKFSRWPALRAPPGQSSETWLKTVIVINTRMMEAARDEIKYRISLLADSNAHAKLAALSNPYPRIIKNNFYDLYKSSDIDFTKYSLYNPAAHPCAPTIQRVFNLDFERRVELASLYKSHH